VTESRLRYTTIAVALHWTIAALILANIDIGFCMEVLARPLKDTVVPLHFSIGITVLALTVARLLSRLTHRPPPLPPGMAWWELKHQWIDRHHELARMGIGRR
jgi:cytochrome b561